MRTFFRGMSLAVSVLLTACGGGGGGGAGGGGGSSSTPSGPVAYTGSTSAAVVTPANASRLAGNILGGDESSAAHAVTGVVVTGPAPSVAPSSLTRVVRSINAATGSLPLRQDLSGARTAATAVDRPGSCESGSARLVGSLNDDNTGSLTVTWNSCTNGGVTFNGQMTLRVDAYDNSNALILDATISFTRLSYRTATANWDMTGDIRVQVSTAAQTETATLNLVVLNNNDGDLFKVQELKFIEVDDNVFARTTYTQAVSGRVYDKTHGFVEIATPTPLRFADANDDFPQSGEMILTGAAGRTIRITALSTQAVRLALDVDGNGSTDHTATLRWTDLSGPAGSDLADSDGDGMHNSWERTYGLDPASAGDRLLDKDGDGISNLAEYRGGWLPNNASSTPIGQAPQRLLLGLARANSDYVATGRSSVGTDGTQLLIVTRQQTDVTNFTSPFKWTARLAYAEGGALPAFDLLPADSDFSGRSAIAFDGTNYLVVATRGGSLIGQRVSAAGALLDAAPGLTLVQGHEPALAYGNGVYLLVYVDWNVRRDLYGVVILPGGAVGTPFPIHSGVDSEIQTTPSVAFDGTNFLVAWDRKAADGLPETSDIRGARIATTGALVGAAFTISAAAEAQNYPQVACDGTNCLVAWVDRRNYAGTSYSFSPGPGDMYAARVAANNTLLDPSAFAIATGITANAGYPALAYNGSQYIAAWSRGAFVNNPGGPTGIYAARIAPDATVNLGGTSTGTALSGAPQSGSRFLYPTVTSTASGAFVAWLNNREVSGQTRELDAVLGFPAP